MASSSVSQEDLENDFELTSRRSRIRSARARTSNQNTARIDPPIEGEDTYSEIRASDLPSTIQGDHDASPKPLGRCKDKRGQRCAPIRQPLADHINRANHMNKGKQQRDRRKLREKRRSTGVVHLQSTESTGGSTGEDEDEVQLSTSAETKSNTLQNEQLTDLPDRGQIMKHLSHRRSKIPSDLDADDEDNQNQSDSTVNSLTQQRPGTPTGEAVEERLERAQAENRRLLSLLEDKDRKIAILESKINEIQADSGTEHMRLREEIDGLTLVVNSLKSE